MLVQSKGWQVVALVLQGREGLQKCRGGQSWTKSNQNCSMGTNLSAAHKVFVEMAEREKVSKF
jgi:hypothetical protein